MIKIVKNRFLDAFLKLMFVSAAIHLVVLIYAGLSHLDVAALNYFSIVGLDLLFPDISKGLMSQVFSLLIIALTYISIFLFGTKKS